MTKDDAISALVAQVAGPILDKARSRKPPKALKQLERECQRQVRALDREISRTRERLVKAAARAGFHVNGDHYTFAVGWPIVAPLQSKAFAIESDLKVRVALGSPLQVDEFTKLIQEALK